MDSLWGYRTEDRSEVHADDVSAMFDNMLEEVYGPVFIGGQQYAHGDALGAVNPTAYQDGMSDFWYSLTDDGEYVEDLEEE